MSETSQCLNCHAPLEGPYCHDCGQSTRGSDRFFLTLVNEAFEDIFSMNSRVWKTFGNLLWHPGFLSNEYFAGRRVRYIPPVRLYFTLSILFFVVYTVASFFEPDTEAVEANPTQELVEEVTDAADGGAKPVETEDSESPTDVEGDAADLPAQEELDFSWLNNERIGLSEERKEAVKQRIEEEVRKAREQSERAGDDSDGDDLEINFGEDDKLDLPWLTEEENQALQLRIEAQAKKAKEQVMEDPDIVADYFLDIAPPIIFALLPVLALLLKIVYINKGMYYTQHLVLAVHNHCFIFLWMTLTVLINWAMRPVGGLHDLLDFLLFLWGPFYLWRSLRNVYGEGRFLTFIKYMVVAILYWAMIGIAAIAAILFGVMTI